VNAIVGPDSEEHTQAEPLGDASDGAPGSLEDHYVRHAPEAVRLAYLLTGDASLAEDLAHEAFIKVAGRFQHLRNPEAFAAYLRKTVVNLSMSHHRRKRVERNHLARESSRPAATTVDPPDVEVRDELRRALRTLPERQRAAIVLRYYEDLPEQQVAHAMGCSVTAARSLVFRAMETLRTQISRGDDE